MAAKWAEFTCHDKTTANCKLNEVGPFAPTRKQRLRKTIEGNDDDSNIILRHMLVVFVVRVNINSSIHVIKGKQYATK